MNRLSLLASFVGICIVWIVAWDLPAQPKGTAKPLAPFNLAALNTKGDEDDPYVSRDGTRLLYTSNVSGHYTLMATQQRNRIQFFPGSERWPVGSELEGQNTDFDNRSPYLTADSHDLYYAEKTVVKAPKEEQQAPANFEIAHAIKLTKPTQFTGPTYVQSVCTPDDEMYPWLTEDGLELYFSRKTKDGWRVFVARRPPATKKQTAGAFGEPEMIKDLPAGYHHVTLSRDNRTMYLQGPLPDNRWGIFRAQRLSVKQPWGPPELLEGLNDPKAPTGDTSPCLSRTGSLLYFSSDRPRGKGGRDLWVIETRWFKK
jgi:WD40-like Beta Propeller Repeat